MQVLEGRPQEVEGSPPCPGTTLAVLLLSTHLQQIPATFSKLSFHHKISVSTHDPAPCHLELSPGFPWFVGSRSSLRIG